MIAVLVKEDSRVEEDRSDPAKGTDEQEERSSWEIPNQRII